MNIHKKGNTYRYDFYFKNKRYRKAGFQTKKDAKIAMNLKLSELIDGYDSSNETSFVDYYNQWLEVTKEGNVTDTTFRRYKSAIRIFEDCFGNIPLTKIDLIAYRRFLKKYGEGYFLNNGALRPRTTNTVSKLHNCLFQALESAVDQGIIKRNPAINARPRGLRKPQEVTEKYMELEQLKNLINYVRDKPHLSYLCIYILIITGSRFTPIRKLRYEHLDYENSTIYIDDQKNKYSPRKLKVRKEDMNYIRSILSRYPINKNGYIFHNTTNFITYKSVNNVMKEFCLKNKYSLYTLKSLRHTHCSYLLANGMSIQYISKRLGHADILTTYRVYSHLIKEYEYEEDNQMLNYLDNLFKI